MAPGPLRSGLFRSFEQRVTARPHGVDDSPFDHEPTQTHPNEGHARRIRLPLEPCVAYESICRTSGTSLLTVPSVSTVFAAGPSMGASVPSGNPSEAIARRPACRPSSRPRAPWGTRQAVHLNHREVVLLASAVLTMRADSQRAVLANFTLIRVARPVLSTTTWRLVTISRRCSRKTRWLPGPVRDCSR